VRYTLSNMASDNYVQRTEARQSGIQSFAFVIGVCVAVCFCIGLAVSNLQGSGQSCEIKLEGEINPNDAPVASLVRLPGIGVGRAEAIVAYREDFSKEGPNKAFQDSDGLQKVKGIGPKTAQNISKWLKFE